MLVKTLFCRVCLYSAAWLFGGNLIPNACHLFIALAINLPDFNLDSLVDCSAFFGFQQIIVKYSCCSILLLVTWQHYVIWAFILTHQLFSGASSRRIVSIALKVLVDFSINLPIAGPFARTQYFLELCQNEIISRLDYAIEE